VKSKCYSAKKFAAFARKAMRECERNPIVKFKSRIDKKTGFVFGAYTFKNGRKSILCIGSFSADGNYGSVIACDPRTPVRIKSI
jgi:hypothetical protein